MQLQGSFTPSPSQSQKQQLALNADALQSLEILRMPLQELYELVKQTLYENPLLEMDVHADSTDGDFAPVSLGADADDETIYPEERPEQAPLELSYRDIWTAGTGVEDPGGMALQNGEQSFAEMLAEQLLAMGLEPGFAQLCLYLVASLNRKGWLEDDIDELAALVGCPAFDLTQALYLVQSLQPTGVGARSLQECLVLQLVQSRHLNPHTLKLVNEGLELLAKNDVVAIEKLLDAPRAQAAQTMAIIRGLNPIPSQGYYTGEQPASVIPEAMVRRVDEGFEVVMNRRTIPRLEICREYHDIKEARQNPEAAAYIREKRGQALRLIRAVDDRESTLQRILHEVIRRQPAFFRGGQGLAPMRMGDVARALGLNISTVSRAVQGKYIRCTAGTIELKCLFTTGLGATGEQALSQEAVKRALALCIQGEDPHQPLSDEDIRQALQAEGITISRRTVAKYREALGIESSSRRRQYT